MAILQVQQFFLTYNPSTNDLYFFYEKLVDQSYLRGGTTGLSSILRHN